MLVMILAQRSKIDELWCKSFQLREAGEEKREEEDCEN